MTGKNGRKTMLEDELNKCKEKLKKYEEKVAEFKGVYHNIK